MQRSVFGNDDVIKGLVLFLAYFVANEAVYLLVNPPAVFPITAAVAFTGLVLWGLRLWPIVAAAAFISTITHGIELPGAILFSFGSTLQAFLGAFILRFFNLDPLFRRMRDIFLVAGVAAVASTIVPTVIYIGMLANIELSAASTMFTWVSRWGGHLWALLIAAPFLIRWMAKPSFTRTPLQYTETVAAFAALIICNYLVFWQIFPHVSSIYVILILFAPFFWISLRLTSRFIFLAFIVTNIMAHIAVYVVPPATAASAAMTIGERLYQLELFMIFMAVIFYLLESIATERRYATEALRSQIDKLKAALNRISSADLAKTEFLSILAHELRNPLAPIVSGLELIKMKGARTPEGEPIVEMMSGRVQVMRRLLDDLLDVSRISRKKMTLKRESVYMQKLLRGSVTAVNEISIQKTHRCELTLAPEPLHIEGDTVRLEQIFINILKNAVKFTPPGGSVMINLEKKGDKAVVSIRDTGMGIDRSMLGKIFEPFVQADQSKIDGGTTGLGIGLSLTKMLVEMHNGTIEAFSEGAGRGSEFIVQLPLEKVRRREVFSADIGKPIAQTYASRSPSKVLVVDDNVHAAEGMGKLLEYRGHKTDMAFSGMDAITRAKIFQPDVILLDIGLPDMSGYEVARLLRSADNYAGKLIALTGYGQEEDKNRAYDAGFDHHLTKPVSVKDVEAVMST